MIDDTYSPVQLVELLLSDLTFLDGGLAVFVEVKSGLCAKSLSAEAELLGVNRARLLTQTLWSRPEADTVAQNKGQTARLHERSNPLT